MERRLKIFEHIKKRNQGKSGAIMWVHRIMYILYKKQNYSYPKDLETLNPVPISNEVFEIS